MVAGVVIIKLQASAVPASVPCTDYAPVLIYEVV